ncbi:MAG: general secretion pathway protein L [Myxococcota bacterium]|jgi:general secretion pathway protein L
MAQTIIGLDIGAFSVKVSTVSASFRSFSWTGYREFEIPHSGRGRPERAAGEILRELSEKVRGDNGYVVCALPGDRAMTRFVTLPFSDPKRIDSVLGFELEGLIPLSVEDMHYTYQVVGETEDGDSLIFAAAAEHETIQRYMETLTDAGLDPRTLTLDTASYVNLYDHVVKDGTAAFIDIGHRTTKICIVDGGQLRLARSVGRGGMAVTQALADLRGVEFEEAEALKHSSGALPMPGDSLVNKDSLAAAKAMKPIVIGIKQSAQAYMKDSGKTIDRIFVTGGGARLAHSIAWLEEQMGQPVEPLDLAALEFSKVTDLGDSNGAAKSLGLALIQAAASRHVTTLNFRRGAYGYEGDFRFVREKLKVLAAMVAVLLMVASAWAVVKNNSLDRVLSDQKTMLASFTNDSLGKRQTSFSKTLKMLRKPTSQFGDTEFFPPMTAIALLDKITSIQQDINRKAARGGAGAPRDPRLPIRSGAITPPGRGLKAGKVGRPELKGSGPRLDRERPGRIGRPPARIGRSADDDDPGPKRRGPKSRDRDGDEKGADRGDEKDGEEKDGEEKDGEEKDGEANAAADLTARQLTKIELGEVDINVYKEVRVNAETHSDNVAGKEEFRKLLAAEPCFVQVKRRDIGAVVAGTGGRHGDWVRFEVKFKVRCPVAGTTEEEKTK